MDIVIPLDNRSGWNNNELRFSLRSLEKYAANVGMVILVGEKPDWIKNVWHIPFENPTNRNHEHNIYEKILAACLSSYTNTNFLAWQDDYFLLDKIDCDNYPYYYNRPLIESVKSRLRFDGYAQSLDNSRKKLLEWNCPTFNYDIHCPIIYNCATFRNSVGAVDWETPNGFVIKSLYANSKPAQEIIATWNQLCAPQQMNDLKINICRDIGTLRAQVAGRHIFSLSDKGLSEPMRQFMRQEYPHKSKYEI